jgi:hypothetical protein
MARRARVPPPAMRAASLCAQERRRKSSDLAVEPSAPRVPACRPPHGTCLHKVPTAVCAFTSSPTTAGSHAGFLGMTTGLRSKLLCGAPRHSIDSNNLAGGWGLGRQVVHDEFDYSLVLPVIVSFARRQASGAQGLPTFDRTSTCLVPATARTGCPRATVHHDCSRVECTAKCPAACGARSTGSMKVPARVCS